MRELERSPQSLYIPSHHSVTDPGRLQAFMDEFPFVELVTAAPEIRISHIPVLLDRTAGKFGTIYGHLARQNPQAALFDGHQSAVIVFRGPHTYISPSWYAKSSTVPTWNYAAVHATGKLRAIDDKLSLLKLLVRLVAQFEDTPRSGYDLDAVPAAMLDGLIGNIVGFAMEIDGLEGKFKLGQERSEADREGILRHLPEAGRERSLYELTVEFYEAIHGR